MSSDTGTVPTRVTSSRFIGRSRELAELEAALADASAGRPSLAFIAGESGVGKTRLLKELERGALAAEARVVSGDCVALGEDELPYAPHRRRPAIPHARRRPRARRARPGHAGRAREPSPRARARPRRRPVDGPRRAGAGAASSRRCSRLLDQPRARRAGPAGDRGPPLGRRLDARLPLLPGAQPARASACWSSPPTAPTSCTAATRCARCSPSSSAGRARGASSSSPLTRAELAEQLEDILGAAPDERARRALYARSEGNPLFTEELLAAGLDGRGELPPTLRDALMVRIEALPAGRPGGAARAGRRPQRSTTRCSPRPPAWSRARCARPCARRSAGHVIEADDDGNYAFRHALLREVVHDDLLPGEHAELHLALAARARAPHAGAGRQRAGSRPAIAHHYLVRRRPAGGASPPPCARPTRPTRSTPTARRRACYERALQLWARVPDPEALAGIDHVDAAVPGRRRAHDDRPRAEALLRGGARRDRRDGRALPRRRPARAPRQRALGPRRRRVGAGHARARPRAAARPTTPSPERALLLGLRAKFLMLRGRYRSAVEAARDALDGGRGGRGAGRRAAARSTRSARSLMALGQVDQGAGKLREALDLGRARRAACAEMRAAYINLADVLHQRGPLATRRAPSPTRAPSAPPGPAATARGSAASRPRSRWTPATGRTPSATCPIPGPSPARRFVNFAPAPRRARPRPRRRGPRPRRCSTTSTPPPSTSTSPSSSA